MKKYSISQEQWLDMYYNPKISKQELDLLVTKTIYDIQTKSNGLRAAVAHSFGKDSLVLYDLCKRAGITECFLVRCDLEYPEFLKYINDNKPKEMKIVNTGQDLKWLAKRPYMLFPKDNQTASRWYSIVQHKGQDMYCEENNIEMLILGRRKEDQNFVGRGTNIYTKKNGVTIFNPIADWTHQQILAYMRYNNIELPPIYFWTNGFVEGTHAWPLRYFADSDLQAWKQIAEIDISIVEKASKYFETAKDCLEILKNK